LRPQIDLQDELDFQPSNLKVTNEYCSKYEAVSMILDENRKIIDVVHRDLHKPLEEATVQHSDGSRFQYTSDTVLRIFLCQIIEGASLREIVIRVDDSSFLRRFVRIYNGPMMDYTALCKLKNAMSPGTWKQINRLLSRYAVEQEKIEGDSLRLDTTAVETNIHWPTDSSLLWDTYRVLGRLIEAAREMDPEAAGPRRLLKKKVQRLQVKIARQAGKQKGIKTLKLLYEQLIGHVAGILEWTASVTSALATGIRTRRYRFLEQGRAEFLIQEMTHYRELGSRVVTPARRRALDDERVPNEDILFSIFEAHTELLKRGQAGKPMEFGHMIQIQQVDGKFISDYEIFDKKPNEPGLLEPALQSHKKLFGEYPNQVAADKGYFEKAVVHNAGQKVKLVSIAQKGNRTDEEIEKEEHQDFCLAQRFRAGVEGTISFLKRVLGLFRCYNQGWEHYVCTVGATVFAHNLLMLARG
jgi:IS5 family transposase